MFNLKNTLVTGGAGFIGSNFIKFLLGQNSETRIINLDLLAYAGSLENLQNLPNQDRYRFIKGNICDRELVDEILREHKIDTIIHFAAESHVDRSISGPADFINTNIIGTFTLLEAVKEYWAGENGMSPGRDCPYRFLHVSTDEVYGSLKPDDRAFTEKTPYDPRSPYSASKAASDHLINAYRHTYGLPVITTNCSNNYGPYQYPEKLIPLMISNALNNKPLPVYGDGGQIRDWLYVEDHCEAIWQVLQKGKAGETYNIGGDCQIKNIEAVNIICRILDEIKPRNDKKAYGSLIQLVEDRPGHDRRYAMNISKIKKEIGWGPKETFETGIRKTIQWYLDNMEWVKKVMGKDYDAWIQKNYGERKPK